MKLFTSGIDKKLFAQYAKGSDLKNQKVIAKIFNPYGKGLWFIINSDPNDPDYLWAIVSLDEVEVGSVSRKELENLRVGKFRLPLERDLYFTPMNAEEVLEGVRKGKRFARGGEVDSIDIDSLKKGDKIKITYSSGISNSKEVELEVRSKTLVNKGKTNEKEKVTFINVANPQGVKYYAYKSMKDGYVGFAIGDMAIWGVKEVSKMAKGGKVKGNSLENVREDAKSLSKNTKQKIYLFKEVAYDFVDKSSYTKYSLGDVEDYNHIKELNRNLGLMESISVIEVYENGQLKSSQQELIYKKNNLMAKGGELKAGVYRIGKPKKISANLYEQKIAEIFDDGEIAFASDYGRKMADFVNQKYPIISQEELDEQHKMAKGGYTTDKNYVAISEKDGYWYIISRPSTKENAQEIIDLVGVPIGEMGKVVTLQEAKEHKKVIGREYLAKGGYMEDGGETENKRALNLLEKIKNQGKLKRYLDVRGNGKKVFETIIPNKSKEGYFKRYESSSPSSIGTLQNEYLDESEVLNWLKKTMPKKEFAKGGYMAQGGWLEHGIFQGDKILKTDGSFLIIEDKNGEIQVVNIEKGVRVNPLLDDSKMGGKRTMVEGDGMEAAENYIEFSKSSMFAKGGEIRYKLAGNNLGQQIENGQKFSKLIKQVYENQGSEHHYPENFIKETAFTGKIVKSDGSYYLKDYTYKGTLTKFEFMEDENFLEALKYLDRPSIKNFKFGKGGHIGFDKLSQKVAKNYEGKAVDKEYQKEYGKRYDADEAREVGDKVAAKVYRLQLAQK